MKRPDLIRSWASDALGVYAPDYVWHPRAQVWQQEGPGEDSVKELFGGSFDQRLAVAARLGMAGPSAERVAAGMDDGMGRAVLTLLRSAAQHRAAAEAAGAEIAELADLGHWWPVENPRSAAAALAAFWARLDRS